MPIRVRKTFRDSNHVPIRDRLSVGLIDEATMDTLPVNLRERLDEIRSHNE